MENSFSPMVSCGCVVHHNRTVFLRVDQKIVMEAPSSLMARLLESCDGTKEIEQVIQDLKKDWEETSLRALIGELRLRGVLIDSRNIIGSSWHAVENPSPIASHVSKEMVGLLEQAAIDRHKSNESKVAFPVTSTSLHDVLTKRHSTRSFSGNSVEFQSIINMLWCAYGGVVTEGDEDMYSKGRRTVPSAGALYPMQIHIGIFVSIGSLEPGVYGVYLGSENAVGFNLITQDTKRFVRAFADPLMLESACGTIVISGSQSLTSEKYGNRAALYVPLEAGHIAQNAHLSATESGVGIVEVGGFMEQLLSEAILLDEKYRPLTTLVFGENGEDYSDDSVEVHWAISSSSGFDAPFTIAQARISEEINDDWSYGRDEKPSLARIKAISEAREWASCGCIPDSLLVSKFGDLKTAIDPRTIIDFAPSQYRMKCFPFAKFNEQESYAWTLGKDEVNGTPVHILADLVYFPYFPETPQYAFANSSGVAAHPDRQKAVETATLELVERDSFMNAYLSELDLPTVSLGTIPIDIRSRLEKLESVGFKVYIKDHSLDLAPVVFVFAQNKELMYTTCASCSSFDKHHALSHALMEVEASVLARLQNGATQMVRPTRISMPSDHGALYEHREYFEKADFMAMGGSDIPFESIGCMATHSWSELLVRFADKKWKLLTVPLHLSKEYGGNKGLHIIRSIVPGMVPMTFGYRQEPGGMQRIYDIAREFGGKDLTYKDLRRLPHPFA